MKLSITKDIDLHVGNIQRGVLNCFADPDKLRDVLGNLIDNSLKYTEKGEVEISIKKGQIKSEVEIWISDTGMGIAPEEIHKIFEKFFRAKNTAHQTGTGLGLYVCDRFVRGMGGTIWIEKSVVGKGTTFVFTVPTTPQGECAIPTTQTSEET